MVDKREGLKTSAKTKGALDGLIVTTVKGAEQKGESWDEEVESRLKMMFGTPSSPDAYNYDATTLHSPSRLSSNKSCPPSPTTLFSATQPLGESSLAAEYSKRQTPIIDMDDNSPASPPLPSSPNIGEEENYPPMPPSGQKRSRWSISPGEDETDDRKPFREGGGARAEGFLPRSWRSASSYGQSERGGIRVEEGSWRW